MLFVKILPNPINSAKSIKLFSPSLLCLNVVLYGNRWMLVSLKDNINALISASAEELVLLVKLCQCQN